MEGEGRSPSESENYADLIVFYLNNPQRLNQYGSTVIQYMNEAFAIVHVPVAQITEKAIDTFSYYAMPKLYGLTSEASLQASDVTKFRSFPNFNLRGNGVLIGIIDTGIDYTNPVFIKPNGTTKIVSIWDQTVTTTTTPPLADFGSEYNSDQINQALALDNPYELVPTKDEIGHGTMLAGVAVGNEVSEQGFAGVVPDSELVIVKLRQAKKYLRDFFVIPKEVDCYQENHIMWGVQYCYQVAKKLNKPIVILTGMGSSQGSHKGFAPLSTLLSIVGDFPNTVVVLPLGNEGNRKRHFHGVIDPSLGYSSVELTVGENDKGFTMELWGDAPSIFTIDIFSPSGELIPKITANLRLSREIKFIFEETKINIDYQIAQTGEQLIIMRFRNASSGTWKFNVYSQNKLPGSFHLWLPMGNMISYNTYFTQADNYITLLEPGTSEIPLVITAYDITNNNLYVNASRGYNRDSVVKPELAAPGVNYIAPNQKKQFVSFTGSSVAAAHTAGIAAMILEWGVVSGNDPDLDTLKVKNYLVRGSIKKPGQTYPNRDWGYGIINIYNVFNVLRFEGGNRVT